MLIYKIYKLGLPASPSGKLDRTYPFLRQQSRYLTRRAYRERAMCRKVLLPVVAIGEIPYSVDNLASLWYHPRITSSNG